MSSVDVFMPCYNCEKYVENAINSILNQTYKNITLYVVNDGSTDSSPKIIQKIAEKDKRVKYYFNDKNKGVSYTTNRVFDLCNSEYIAFMDADDIATPDRIRIEKEYLDSHKDIGVVSGLIQHMTNEGELLQNITFVPNEHGALLAAMITNNPIANGSVMVRNSVLKKTSIRFDQKYSPIQDYKFWSELIFETKFHVLNNIFQYYRDNPLSITHTAKVNENIQRYNNIHSNIINHICKDNLSKREKEIYLSYSRDLRIGRSNKGIFPIIVKRRYEYAAVLNKIRKVSNYKDDDFDKYLGNFIRECRFGPFDFVFRR